MTEIRVRRRQPKSNPWLPWLVVGVGALVLLGLLVLDQARGRDPEASPMSPSPSASASASAAAGFSALHAAILDLTIPQAS